MKYNINDKVKLNWRYQTHLVRFLPTIFGISQDSLFPRDQFKTITILLYATYKRIKLKGIIVGYGARINKLKCYYRVNFKTSLGSFEYNVLPEHLLKVKLKKRNK